MYDEFKAYVFTIKDQEIATKYIVAEMAERKYIKHHHRYKMHTL